MEYQGAYMFYNETHELLEDVILENVELKEALINERDTKELVAKLIIELDIISLVDCNGLYNWKSQDQEEYKVHGYTYDSKVKETDLEEVYILLQQTLEKMEGAKKEESQEEIIKRLQEEVNVLKKYRDNQDKVNAATIETFKELMKLVNEQQEIK